MPAASFFFAPHWSAGFELNIVAGLEFSRSKKIRDGVATASDTYDEKVFVLDGHYLRMLYMSWHFGEE